MRVGKHKNQSLTETEWAAPPTAALPARIQEANACSDAQSLTEPASPGHPSAAYSCNRCICRRSIAREVLLLLLDRVSAASSMIPLSLQWV